VEIPDALVNREMARRLEQIVQRMAQQQIDPRTANVDWEALREEQRAPATDTVRGSLLLDEIARRETLTVTDDDVDQEVTRYAERLGQTPAAVRAQLDKDHGLAALAEGLRREKTVELLLSRATIVTA
jgi:trigger factor